MVKDINLLNKIHKDTRIGSKTLNSMLPKITNKELRNAVIKQINEYDKINSDAKSEISNLGQKTQSHVLTSVSASIGAKLTTMSNPSPSHLAEMIIKNSNAEMVSLTKEMNKSLLCKPSTYDLGRRLIKTQESSITRIKAFL